MNKISLFDIDGKQLAAYSNVNAASYVLDISTYPAGTYVLDVDGITLRFVVNR